MKLAQYYSFLHQDINIIEEELQQAISSSSQTLNEASLHLLQAGGKRIRPVFVLLGGKFGEYNIDVVKNVAVSLELIHMASLVLDDVIDDAEIRRGIPTVKSQWDNKVAMYTGDYIFARSLDYMLNIPNPEAHKILSDAIVEVCKGEIAQIKDKYLFEQSLRDYLRRIKRKTALLIAVSCQLGAIVSGAPREVHERLYRFGYYVGMSFQIIDDILDFTATADELGKPAGGDLLQGNITLPVLFAMEDPILRQQITLVHENISSDELQTIIVNVKNSDAIERSHQVSQQYLKKAIQELRHLPKNKAKSTLRDIATYLGKRKY
ncbi:heptaprenyl diphosphate synthase [Bacillus coahuilensis p1.1.43]|uniref:Heptaprenyl diphosphate synthase component 2 n=1 Tax=Bacillus coahuilensis p1.1.43 TaxID=1150625 RepID=A0A147K8W9_9BACI|nr:heptaprenyl diphosphate synthase component II [Bacillus coahuilensis]KUP06577.1 heptaprenyl diphosphate synthase [Bacillus coahuilensis p1.1.43]